jgi:hypothetical protein
LAAEAGSGRGGVSLAWKNMSPTSLGVDPGREAPTLGKAEESKCGDAVVPLPPFGIPCAFESAPSALLTTGRFAPAAVSTVDAGLEAFGVPLGVPLGVEVVLSTLDFLDDDRGVMLWLISVLTGVDSSSFGALPRTVSGVLLRAELRDSGGVAL